jgi:hypothetical protein
VQFRDDPAEALVARRLGDQGRAARVTRAQAGAEVWFVALLAPPDEWSLSDTLADVSE